MSDVLAVVESALGVMKRLADFRHACLRKNEGNPLTGVIVSLDGSVLSVTVSNTVIAAQSRFHVDPVEDSPDVWIQSLDRVDLWKAADAMNTRASSIDMPERDDLMVRLEFLRAGLRASLYVSHIQAGLFDDDTEDAETSYQIRRVTEAVSPDITRVMEAPREDPEPGDPIINPIHLHNLLKTYSMDHPIQLSTNGSKGPLHAAPDPSSAVNPFDPLWRGMLMPLDPGSAS